MLPAQFQTKIAGARIWGPRTGRHNLGIGFPGHTSRRRRALEMTACLTWMLTSVAFLGTGAVQTTLTWMLLSLLGCLALVAALAALRGRQTRLRKLSSPSMRLRWIYSRRLKMQGMVSPWTSSVSSSVSSIKLRRTTVRLIRAIMHSNLLHGCAANSRPHADVGGFFVQHVEGQSRPG